jgi:flagellar hook protein FlgE
MFESINAGATAMYAFARALNNISSNVANLNTSGYKRSSMGFQDLLVNQDALLGYQGNGVGTGKSTTVFTQGELRSSGNPLDAGVEGAGYFVVQGREGKLYTRDGGFDFNGAGTLVSRQSNLPVLAYTGGGSPTTLSIANARSIAGVATTTVKFDGSLSTSDSDKSHTISDIGFYDQLGVRHAASIVFSDQTDPTVSSINHTWNFTLTDDTNRQLATGQLVFGPDGSPQAGSDKVSFNWSPQGSVAQPVTLDFGDSGSFGGMTSFSVGTVSTAKLTSVDGSASGSLSSTSFLQDGSLQAQYSNGQTRNLGQLALAFFSQPQDLQQGEFNLLSYSGELAPQLGRPGSGQFGVIGGGQIEASNVDLTQQFSELIIIQRGFQGGSQILTAANEMLQQMMEAGGRR